MIDFAENVASLLNDLGAVKGHPEHDPDDNVIHVLLNHVERAYYQGFIDGVTDADPVRAAVRARKVSGGRLDLDRLEEAGVLDLLEVEIEG